MVMQKSFGGRMLLAAAAPAFALAAVLVGPGTASAAFPGANAAIAYVHEVDMSSASIYSVNPGGGTPKNLSEVGSGSATNADFQPSWSADGSHLAFVRVDMQNCSGQIWTMSADGTGQTNRSNDAATANEINPAYGPDGSIVFVRAAAGTFGICSQHGLNQGDLWIRAAGGTTRQLTTGGSDNTPAWSPDGTKIAFTRLGSGGPHIFVMNANGSGTPRDLGPGLKPNWSPDGSKIVFAAAPAPGSHGPSGGPVTVMNADGSSRRTLNQNGTAPAWSPDGKQIVYLGFDQATQSSVVAVMNADGSNQHNITSPGSGNEDVKPDWQPKLRQLRLSVTPRRTTAGQRTCFSFRARSGGHGVAGAVIRLGRHHAVSSRSGNATLCARLSAGGQAVQASKPGYRVAAARVVAARHVRRPAFTG
jgi:dipeptidyl aminopeptidase/acylaminoacyl peptidase